MCNFFHTFQERDRCCVPKTKSNFLCVKSLKPRRKANVKTLAEAGKRVSLSTVNGVLQVSPEGKKENTSVIMAAVRMGLLPLIWVQ